MDSEREARMGVEIRAQPDLALWTLCAGGLASDPGDHQWLARGVRMALEAGADPDGEPGRHPSYVALVAGAGRVECLRSLLDAGARVGVDPAADAQALAWAIQGSPYSEGGMRCALLLIERGAAAASEGLSRMGATLCLAAAVGEPEIVEALLAAGADPNERSVGAGRSAVDFLLGADSEVRGPKAVAIWRALRAARAEVLPGQVESLINLAALPKKGSGMGPITEELRAIKAAFDIGGAAGAAAPSRPKSAL